MDKNFYISTTAMDLMVFPTRKAGLRILFLLCKQKIRTSKKTSLCKKYYLKSAVIKLGF